MADGVPRTVVPAGQSFMALFDQALLWVRSCDRFWEATGDAAFREAIVPATTRLLERCRQEITADGLFVPPAFSWHWVDWAPLDKRPYSLAVNALLLLAAHHAVSLAQGDERLTKTCAALMQHLEPNLVRFYDINCGCFRAHLPPNADLPAQAGPFADSGAGLAHDLHGNALACLAGVGTAAQRDAAASFLARRLAEPSGPHNMFGPGWTEIILSALFLHGRGAEALHAVRRMYQPALDAGAPTWGESFDSERFNSAHGWGASVNILLSRQKIG